MSLVWVVLGVQVVSVFLSALAMRKGDVSLEAVYMVIAYGAAFLWDLGWFIASLARHDYLSAGFYLAAGAFCAWMIRRWWRKWKDRKKITQLLGAKSRALREKLVRVMREGQQPSPVKVPS